MGQIWEQTQTFWFHFLLDAGTFVERLLLYCFAITTRDGYKTTLIGYCCSKILHIGPTNYFNDDVFC
jgi:hypothetical protein